MTVTDLIAQGWRDDLEHEPDCWGLRVFRPGDSGYVWRNRAARDHYAQFGFFPSETLPWSGVVTFFEPDELARLEAAYERAFLTQEPVYEVIAFSLDDCEHTMEVTFIMVHGTLEMGVLVTHSHFSECVSAWSHARVS